MRSWCIKNKFLTCVIIEALFMITFPLIKQGLFIGNYNWRIYNGMVLTAIYYRTRNIVVVIFLHDFQILHPCWALGYIKMVIWQVKLERTRLLILSQSFHRDTIAFLHGLTGDYSKSDNRKVLRDDTIKVAEKITAVSGSVKMKNYTRWQALSF